MVSSSEHETGCILRSGLRVTTLRTASYAETLLQSGLPALNRCHVAEAAALRAVLVTRTLAGSFLERVPLHLAMRGERGASQCVSALAASLFLGIPPSASILSPAAESAQVRSRQQYYFFQK